LSPKTAIVAGRLILQSVPDLMIVEVDMPFMNRIEFLAPLKADGRTRDIPVVYADRLLEIVAKRLRPKAKK